MNQILLGAAIPFLVLALIYAIRRGRGSLLFFACAPLWLAAGALWAVVPDLPRLLGREDLYFRLAKDPRMDLFFWHYTIDRIEDEWFPYHIPLVILVLLLIAAAWREVRRREEGAG
jgi:hypothetical protein